MTSGGHCMPPDFHIVWRIEKSRIGTRPVSHDPLQESGIATVATSDSVFPENPDIAWLRPWCCRNGRDDFVIRIGGRRQNHVISPVEKPVSVGSISTSSEA